MRGCGVIVFHSKISYGKTGSLCFRRLYTTSHCFLKIFVYTLYKFNEIAIFLDNITVQLTDDFIKVDFIENEERSNKNNTTNNKKKSKTKVTSEFHMYPLRKPPQEGQPPFKKYTPDKDKYNVLMVMLDSVSHACAQRYIPKTYKMLSENPYNTIMQVLLYQTKTNFGQK